MLLRRDSIFCMENLNPCNIQRSLGEIRCLFCFVCLTLIDFFFCLFVSVSVHGVFWRMDFGCKANTYLSGRSRGFWIWILHPFSVKLKAAAAPPADWRRHELSLVSSLSVSAEKAVQKSPPTQLCWVMSILVGVYTNVWCSPCLHLCT